MVNVRTLVAGFMIVYLLMSLPAMFGIGFVIDWNPEATFSQQWKGYVMEGLAKNYLIKIVISIIVSVIFSLFLSKYKAMQGK